MKEMQIETVGKLFIVVRGMRQCLICERLFTPMEAAGHSMMPCKVGAVRAVRASRPDITSVMSFRAKS
jgi:hypothetical protein